MSMKEESNFEYRVEIRTSMMVLRGANICGVSIKKMAPSWRATAPR
jgi:hypothetical protein